MKEAILLWEMTNRGVVRVFDDRGRELGESPDPGGVDDGVDQGASDICRKAPTQRPC